MGRRANYGFEKRQKEIKRKKKREEKLARQQAKRDSSTEGEPGAAAEGEQNGAVEGEAAADSASSPEPQVEDAEPRSPETP